MIKKKNESGTYDYFRQVTSIDPMTEEETTTWVLVSTSDERAFIDKKADYLREAEKLDEFIEAEDITQN